MNRYVMKSIPNILSVLRIVIAPFLLYLAWNGHKYIFIALLIVSLLSDAIDGFIARKFNASTETGAKLDSLGDMATYLTVPFCAWWLWPEILKREAPYFFLAIGAYIIPLAAGILKFRKVPSYHTYGAKISAIIMSIAILFLFIAEFTLFFTLASIFHVIIALEEVLITFQLHELRSNVKSIWHLNNELTTHP